MDSIFKVKLKQFEGPFDLLLFFIERDEIDIYDIPIHQIIQEFFFHIQSMEELDMEMASEFILFASTLMRIKSRMLLPRKEIDEEGNEVDPREELVARLLQYKRFKDISEEISGLESMRQQLVQRALANEQLKSISKNASNSNVETDLSMYELLKAFHTALENKRYREDRPEHVVVRYNYTLESQKEFIDDLLSKLDTVYFDELFENMENRVHAIFTFLAILDMVQLKEIGIVVGASNNSFQVKKLTEVTNDLNE